MIALVVLNHLLPKDINIVTNATDRPPVHMKTGDFENGRFENGTLTDTFWKRHCGNTR